MLIPCQLFFCAFHYTEDLAGYYLSSNRLCNTYFVHVILTFSEKKSLYALSWSSSNITDAAKSSVGFFFI